MALTYPGGYITKSPPAPTSTSAPGVWTLEQAMQYIKAGTWPTPPIGDPYWQYTALLSGTGSTNGAQNNTFIDSSSNNFTVTRNGNTTQGTFTPFSAPSGYWGNSFDGSGDYLTVPYNANLALGTSDFTIEAWLYPNTLAAAQDPFGMHADSPISSADIAWFMYVGADNSGNSISICNGTTDYAITGWSLTANVWQHVALTRSSGSLKFFINGVQVGSTVSANVNINNNTAWKTWIGTYTAASRPFNGYISNFRIVKGTAVYTSNFTPSTSPLTAISNTQLLTCQSNRFIDNSTNTLAITANGNAAVLPFAPFGNPNLYSTTSVGGSGYFDGTGDYLSIANNAAIQIGSSDMTLECWVYSAGSQGGDDSIYRKSNGYTEYTLFWQSATQIRFVATTDGASWTVDMTANSIPSNSWVHVAVTRSGSNWTIWINGVSAATDTQSGTVTTNTSAATVGGSATAGLDFEGFISGLRLVKGTAVYTAPFTPPTTPPTAIANTSLLLNFTNAGIYDQAAENNFETVGNAQVSTSVVKYGNGSMYFDGVGDRLYRWTSPLYNFGSGDFTVECWVYIAANTSYATLIDFSNDGGGGYGWMLEYSATRGVLFYMGTGGGNSNISYSFTPPLTTWTHVAVTRAGGYAKIFINGNQVAAASLTSSSVSTNPLVIGSSKNGTYPFNGYLSDVRITKGLARYTYNFTPPTRAFGAFFQAAATPTADPYFDYTTLLLPGSGTNGAQNNTFLDSSTNAFSITRNGNTTQGTFSPFSQTGWSNYFDGTGDYLSATANAAFNFGTGDFTVEFWLNYSNASGAQTVFDINYVTAANLLLQPASGQMKMYVNGNATTITSEVVDTAGQWNHYAIVRSGTTITMYRNGMSVGSVTYSGNVGNSTSNAFVGGSLGGGGFYLNGYLSNFRIVKGTAVYTSNFTPPTTPLTAITNTSLLTCQSNRFVDNSSNAFTLTANGNTSVQAFSPFAPTAAYSAATNGGSGYFDNSGDYLTTPNSSQFAPSGDFTISLWYYPVSTDAYQQVIGNYNASTGSSEIWLVEITSGTGITFFTNGTTPRITGANKLTVNAWNYIVLARSGSTITGYVNGASVGTYTQSGTFGSASQEISIGRGGSLTNVNDYAYGYIAGVRLLDGTVDTTVPTAPPANATGTKLLCNFTNAGIYDATAKNDLETVGNAQISNTTAKFGSTSMYFDGTGDYLTVRSGPWLQMGGDFTLECWVYSTTSSGSGQVIFGAVDYWRNSLGLQILSNRTVKFNMCDVESSSGVYDEVTTTSTVPLNTWTHIAVVRYGSTLSVYINGVSGGSTSSTRINYIPTGLTAIASDGGSYLNSSLFTGYIQDLRVTNGIARYTQNFTPPTAAFQLL